MSRIDEVRDYYDTNTRSFLRHGHGAATGSIHRAVWGKGATSREQAMRWVEDRIAERLAGARAVLDIGCGVGGTMLYLAARLESTFSGITLSPVQAGEAGRRIEAAGLAQRCAVRAGSFFDEIALGAFRLTFDGAYAIEAFIHADGRSEDFFRVISGRLRTGARLVLVDDFLLQKRASLAIRDARALSEFETFWRARAVRLDELAVAAQTAGMVLEEELDLDPWLELGRPRDRAIAALIPVLRLGGPEFRKRPFVGNLIGGNALQFCLRRGVLGYRLLTFRKVLET